MALYTIVCLIGDRLNKEAPVLIEKAAWYDKRKVTFSDLLKAVRIELWRDNLFSRKEFLDPSVKIQLQDEEQRVLLRDLLVQMLTQAA